MFQGYIQKESRILVKELTWRNVYNIEAADLAEAMTRMQLIRDAEADIHAEGISLNKIFVAQVGFKNQFRTNFTTSPGLRSVTGDFLPAWNVVKTFFDSTDGTRPEVKYLRIGLTENDVTGELLDTGLVDLIQTNYVDVLAGYDWYVGPGGETHGPSDPGVGAYVYMRQTKWHRHSRPGQHRAYVPNT